MAIISSSCFHEIMSYYLCNKLPLPSLLSVCGSCLGSNPKAWMCQRCRQWNSSFPSTIRAWDHYHHKVLFVSKRYHQRWRKIFRPTLCFQHEPAVCCDKFNTETPCPASSDQHLSKPKASPLTNISVIPLLSPKLQPTGALHLSLTSEVQHLPSPGPYISSCLPLITQPHISPGTQGSHSLSGCLIQSFS